MKSVKERVRQFNLHIKDKYYHLTFDKPASEVMISKIQGYYKTKIPISLRWFYREIGGITGNSNEFVMNIENIPYLLKKLNEPNKWFKCDSLGFVDYLRFLWGNDRPEFESFDPEKVAYLNENYRCFGHYRFSCGLTEANILYFDKAGKFGEVRYHEKEFENVWTEFLNDMLVASPASEDLEHMLIRILNKLETGAKNRDKLVLPDLD